MIASGDVRRLLTGVYVAADVNDSLELRLAAVSKVVAPGHIACDRTAAWLHGVDAYTYGERAVLPPVETCVRRGSGATQRSDVRGRTRDLVARDVVDLKGALVTTPLRTALDLGCNLTRKDALAAIDQLRRIHGVGLEALMAELPRFYRRRGVIQLRSLIPITDPRSESPRESWVRMALIDAGLPAPEPQWWVDLDAVSRARLDHAYPEHRVAVEYDGREFHSETEKVEADLERRRRLRQLGWVVVVVRLGDFTGDRLDYWLSEVRRALADRPTNLRW